MTHKKRSTFGMAFINEQWKERMHRAHKSLNSSPLILGILGIGTLGLWACGTMVQIQTSELLALGGNTVVAGVNWELWQQPRLPGKGLFDLLVAAPGPQ
jgi:hypothetical protein